MNEFKIALQDFKFQARMKISCEPITKAFCFVGNSEGQDCEFQARLKFSSETENFKRDCFFKLPALRARSSSLNSRVCRQIHIFRFKGHSQELGPSPKIRKILVSVKFFVRSSGAGNGCANLMGAWKHVFFLQEKPMCIKFLL